MQQQYQRISKHRREEAALNAPARGLEGRPTVEESKRRRNGKERELRETVIMLPGGNDAAEEGARGKEEGSEGWRATTHSLFLLHCWRTSE
jgi:hypothetical protein